MGDAKARAQLKASRLHMLVQMVAARTGVTGRRLDMPKHVRDIARTEQEGELSWSALSGRLILNTPTLRAQAARG